MSPHLSTVDQDKRLHFLEGFHTAAKARERNTWGTTMFSIQRLNEFLRSDSSGGVSQYSIGQGLEMTGLVLEAKSRRPATKSQM